MEKRRHHHVWQYYSAAWAVDGRVWCLRDRQQLRPVNTVNLGVKNHFYRLQKLTPRDRRLIHGLIQSSPKSSRPGHLQLLDMFDGWHEMTDALDNLPGDTSELRALAEQQIANAEEDYHAAIEGAAIPVLTALRAGDATMLDDPIEAAGFCHFVSVQNIRTVGVRTFVLTPSPDAPKAFDATGAWAISSHIAATNAGASIFMRRRENPLRLITNATDVPFITSDQPVTNLQAPADRSPPEHLSLYYPVSPKYAVFVDEAQHPFGLEDVITSADRVRQLNEAMVEASHSQVYALTEACLEPYRLPPPG